MTLREKPWGNKVSRILASSLAAVDPAAALQRALHRNGNILNIPEQKILLDDFRNVYILAIGKASISMSVAAADLISGHLTHGAVLTKLIGSGIPKQFQEKLKLYKGNHPIPDQENQRSTDEILKDFSDLNPEDLVLVLISGGGSALFTSPAPDISLHTQPWGRKRSPAVPKPYRRV